MDKFQEILHTYWGFSDFRGIQRDIIESIAAGKDTLGLMPTGGGKSITFQVPALAQEGVCIVITPLIALMKDQVQHLKERGIQAAAIHADKSRSEVIQILENCIFGGIKILYVSPERLASEIFQTKLRHIPVSFITVDEAHCISQWGYDFRPSYLNIASIRDMKPDTPILALTATATPDVVNDIQEKLHFEKKNVFKMSFERKNLAYIVRTVGDKINEMVHILRCTEGSAIVYARSRKRTKEIATLLNQNGIKSTFYHAGLLPSVKDERQKAWQQDEVRVIVANILADILIHLTEDAYRLVKDEGYLIMSGIIKDKWDMVRESAESAGFFLETHMIQGEWNACVFKKTKDVSGVIGG